MRIWYVPLNELDNQRLLGQHHEIHGLHTLIVKREQPWGGLTWCDEPFIVSVHDAAVEEMTKRRMKHHTPIVPVKPMANCETQTATLRRLDSERNLLERMDKDRWHLILRWGGKYLGDTILPHLDEPIGWQYRALIQRYEEQGGCLHDGQWEVNTKDRLKEDCTLCKSFSRTKERV
jgi:hypothetical protein